MSNLVCQNCKSIAVEYEDYVGGTSYYRCKTCGMRGNEDKFTQVTLFDRITASLEALAPTLVYAIKQLVTIPSTSRENPGGYEVKTAWFSTIVDGDFDSESEAIAATVAKLKEVYNG
jgi:hypothetical protein